MGKNQVKSKNYKNVYFIKNPPSMGLKKRWIGEICRNRCLFKTEKEAARYIDIVLISKGKEPVNILKRVLTKN